MLDTFLTNDLKIIKYHSSLLLFFDILRSITTLYEHDPAFFVVVHK